ncbi:MAG TPA: cation diffusion facilitator family transporter [Candidatus Saccharimonadales bacterium]|nr:cation diffusion facilitator family transporter [Candidatus Saccharimonadales bacterium]
MHSSSSDRFEAGEWIAKISVFTLLIVGIVELLVGRLTGSVGLVADGVDSLLDSLVSLIVWVGLHYSRRRPDARFHFGYHKVETLSAFLVAISMIAIGCYIMIISYLTFLNPRIIEYPFLALLTLLIAGFISMYRAFQMRAIAKRFGLLSIRTDANNAIKDASASFVVFAGVLGASFGLKELDAVGGMIIGVYILGLAYVTIKEASLILLDACESPEMTSVLSGVLRTVPGVRDITSIRLRPSGPYLMATISVMVDGSETVANTENMRKRIIQILPSVIEPIGEITVIFRSTA